MTEKQQNILKAALKLFASEGYASTSTSKVAREAGVSEGLIFRHFKNKEGLLAAVLQGGMEKAQMAYADIMDHEDPKEVLRKALELPFLYPREEYEVWRLIYALKWQTGQAETSDYEYIKEGLAHAFTKLGYANPKAEAELVFMFMDGAATAMLLHEPANKMEVLKALKEKYDL